MNMKEEVVYHYYNLKDKLKKASDKITQRKGAEDNKIKFRETFVTKCKRAYRSILTKYYIKKEANILAKKEEYPEEKYFNAMHGADLKNAAEKKVENMNKLEEHNARLEEIQRIKAERDAKANEVTPVESVQEVQTVVEPVVEEKVEQPVAEVVKPVEPIAPVVEPVQEVQTNVAPAVEEKVEQPVVEETATQIMNQTENTLAEGVQQIVEAEQATEQIMNQVENTLAEDVQQMVAEQQAPKVEEAKVEETKTVEVDNSAQALLNKFAEFETEFSNDWKKTMESVANVVISYNSKIQKASAEALASKQNELNLVKNERDAYVEENTQLKASNSELNNTISQKNEEISRLNAANQEKDSRIQGLVLENQNKDSEIARLNGDIQTMSAQFRQMQAMFNNFQTMMGNTMQANVAPAVEEQAVQKTLV